MKRMFTKTSLICALVFSSLLMFFESNAQTYCIPTYSTGCAVGDDIKDVKLQGDVLPGINNLNTLCASSSYSDYTSMSATLTAGFTYSGNVTTNYSSASEDVKIWIDYNNDGVFQATEEIATLSSISNSSTGAFTFTVPITQNAGARRMRVRLAYSTPAATIDPCISYSYGETHDYTVNIIASTPCTGTPVAGTLPATMSVCAAVPFTIAATGSTLAGNMANQWQSRTPAGTGSWVNVIGAVTAAYTNMVGISVPTDYRYIAKCNTSGLSDTTTVLAISINAPSTCYCTPTTTNVSTFINDFYTTGAVTNVSNMGSGYSGTGYGNFTALSPNIAQIHTGTVTFNANYVGSTFGTKVWVDWNQNGSFADPGEEVYVSSTYSANATGTFTVPTTALSGNTRMRIGINYINATGPINACENITGGEYEDYTLYVIPNVPNNAGLTTLTAPLNFCAGATPQQIKVKVRNFGNNIMNSVMVQWQLNGVMQTTYNLTTPLDTINGTGINEVEVTLGTFVFGTAPVAFKAWTTMPNGVPDTSNINDTLTRTLQASLSGTYTINSAVPTGGMNFQSFTAFTTTLNTYGVCGPVIANVMGGPFVEKVSFGNIAGTSPVNYIKVNGNGATVQFTNTTSDRQLLTLNGTKYLTIDSLTFKSLATDFGWGALITNGAAHDSIINCYFDLTSVTSVSSVNTNGITFSSMSTSPTSIGSNGSHCYIGNNKLKWADGLGGGYYAFSIAGACDSNVIANNDFENFYYYGAYINGGTGTKVINNTFHKENKTASLTTFYGIYTTGITPGMEISRNRIHHPGGLTVANGTFYGIAAYGDGTLAQPSVIANNLFYHVNQNGILYGIYLSTAPYTSIYHNTFVYDQPVASTSATYGIYATGVNTASNIKNNNIVITGGTTGIKYGFYYTGLTSVGDVQKNNFYMNSTQAGVQNYGYLAAAFATQAAFQTANPLLELGSPTADPLFVAPLTGNFNVQSPALMGSGANLMGLVPIDINGSPRAATPTIGAYEQAPSGSNNAGTIAFITPTGLYCAGSQSVSVSINNGGVNNITSLKLNWTVNGVLQPQVSYNSTLVPITSTSGQNSDTVTLGNATIPNGTPTIIKAWTSLPNGVADMQNNNDTVLLSFQATQYVAAAASDTICSGASATLSLTPATGYAVGVIQWQSSPTGTLWSAIPGANAPTYTALNVTANTYYRAKIGIGLLGGCYSNSVLVSVVNVSLLSSTPGERCGPGTVSLSATGSAGTIINWYSQATGGAAIGTGSPFTTPSITATTTYYAAAALGGAGTSATSLTTLTGGGNGCDGGTMFDIIPVSSLSLDSFQALATGAGIEVKVYTRTGTYLNNGLSATGWTLHATIPMTYAAGLISIPLPTPIPLIGGTTNGIYIMYNASYTNGVGTNQTFTNADMTINGGYGLCSEFGGINDPRIFNGTVYYSSAGCESPRVPVLATIKPSPTVNLGNDTTICPGATLTLNAGNPGNTYLWNNNTTAQTLNVTAAGTYSVKVTGSNTCSKSDTIIITAGAVPLNSLAAATDLCEGDTLTLDAGNAGSTYLWSNAATTQTTNVNAPGAYSVVIKSVDGCNLTSNTTVTSRPLPIVNLGSDTAICTGDQIVLNAGNLGMNYLWSTGANTQTIITSTANNYSVTVTSSFNCKGRDTIAVTTLPLPTVDAFNTIDLSNEQAGKMQFNAVNPQNVTSYDWDFGDNSTHGTTASPIHIYTSNGTFTVTLKVMNDCGEDEVSFTVTIEGVGIAKLNDKDVNFTLYPNPTTAEVVITNGSADVTIQHISIVNVLGAVVFEKATNTDKVQKVNVSNLASGLYTARVMTDKGLVVMKFEVIK